VNAGFFVLKREIFKYMEPGDELVIEPFQRLIGDRELAAYEYDGFFQAMDTFKDKQQLDDLYESGQPPWQVWTKTNALTNNSTATRFDTLPSSTTTLPVGPGVFP
jgi:glucose-1-phosphate cytidylyltransferase